MDLLKKFEGCYKSSKITADGTEHGKIKICAKDNVLDILNLDNGEHLQSYKINDNSFIRYDGALVTEWISKGFFGNNEKNSTVFKPIHDNNLIRKSYRNYSFKDLFGNYWFTNHYDKHVWKKVPCRD